MGLFGYKRTNVCSRRINKYWKYTKEGEYHGIVIRHLWLSKSRILTEFEQFSRLI